MSAPFYTEFIPSSNLTSAGAARARGRRPSLSETDIVVAALRVVEEVGLRGMSMRAVARELGVPPMTIYYHIASKEILQELVVDSVLAAVRVPGREEGTWDQRLRQLERDARAALAAHPGMASAGSEHGGTREGMRLAEGVLRILDDAGFTPEAAVICFAALYTFMTGQIDLDAMAGLVVGGSAGTTLAGVTASSSLSRDELFELGFDSLIQGLRKRFLEQ